jgi:hypothetical protein
MMDNRCVPNRVWDKAMFRAIYVMNKYPTMEMKQKMRNYLGGRPK